MKNLKHNFKYLAINILSIFFLITIITSCSKDGKIGPKGDTGSTGAAGAAGSQGTQGIPGKDGALIISGNGIPSSSTGNNGDMYLDKTTSNLYGPKSASGWGAALSLKGDTGATGQGGVTGQVGANGSIILNGTTVPTIVGNNGDYYLNKTNADFYGPKSIAGWGTPINLKGSANVVASTWMSMNAWNVASYPDFKYAHYVIPTPVLNAVGYSSLGEMLDKGGVFLLYLRWGSFDYQLPLTTTFGSQPFFIQYTLKSFYFTFQITSYNNLPLAPSLVDLPNSADNKLRYVLIPAGTQITTTANLKDKTYEEVMELLKKKD